jgi:hypothetical protein
VAFDRLVGLEISLVETCRAFVQDGSCATSPSPKDVLGMLGRGKHKSLTCVQLGADVVAVRRTHILDDLLPGGLHLPRCGVADVVVEDVFTESRDKSLFLLLGCRNATAVWRVMATASAVSSSIGVGLGVSRF